MGKLIGKITDTNFDIVTREAVLEIRLPVDDIFSVIPSLARNEGNNIGGVTVWDLEVLAGRSVELEIIPLKF